MEITTPLSILPKNKIIVVTGGYGHLGKAICESLSAHGSVVYVLGRTYSKFEKAFGDSEFKDLLHFVEGDISKSESLRSGLLEISLKHDGEIDGIINNAFYARGQSPEEMSRRDFNYTLDGTLTSVFEVIKYALPHLHDQSSIVNVSSMYGMVAPDFAAYEESPQYLNPPHYGAAKAGVIQLSKYYASYLGKLGIRVNSVSPGPFPNSQVQQNKAFMQELEKRSVLNKYGLPHELAGIFTFLMSDASCYITGQNFTIDGGWTVR